MIHKSPVGKMDFALIKLYLDEVFYPILDGLMRGKATGSKTIFSENMLETQSFTKTEE